MAARKGRKKLYINFSFLKTIIPYKCKAHTAKEYGIHISNNRQILIQQNNRDSFKEK